jgi:hypothetical protein
VPFIILQLPFKYSNEISVSFFEMLIGTSLLYSGICAVKNKEIPGYIVYSWMQNKSAERFGTIFIIIGSLLAIGGLIKLLLLLV